MRMASSRQAAAGSVSARETPVVEACQVLTSLVAEDADRKPVFLAEGGVIALMELLEERSTKVRPVFSYVRSSACKRPSSNVVLCRNTAGINWLARSLRHEIDNVDQMSMSASFEQKHVYCLRG
jgi:hypothetical protein